ncbi:MAG: hypothetical protein HY343_12005 [Lentisphaerae bacterium]|nr:hypothetical protein [Lentisphaerota bacterium]
MCRVKAVIKNGPIDSERLALINTSDGKSVEVILAKAQVTGETIRAAEIGRDAGRVLVELPRETTAGSWRIWVKTAAIVRG